MYHADTMTEKDKEDVKNEAKILATLNHPNIVQYQETYTVSTGPCTSTASFWQPAGIPMQHSRQRPRSAMQDNRDGRLILVMELAEVRATP